ncbi:DNA polymerase-3 subunit alpha [Paenibacillus sp. UNCCL117]|uniref:DNA polymerase III subunit alpha n=1 Tax=unclassified Paenibacillus TaxID=185978 RepID=UPI000883E491|nr:MULTISPECIES: DNA polymerase III subunit alpha [unclassified Paenibacillus]SDC08639.1 DNA polymerase-3 subunit alpha [Paenibacillus sp. cl123]SFW38298.1 DNA polymerase-3 subunit alpha [Paenibacillus sp. UNCCL117]
MSDFVHLHVHSEYSLLDGAARIDELVGQAASMGMKALALTDHGVMYGAIPFYKACKAKGIKPIIGCEVYFTTGSLRQKGSRQEQPIYHLILLAKNLAGYRNLMRLVSVAHLEGFHYKPRIDLEHLERYSEGLICTSACLGSEVSQHLLHGRYEEAKAAAHRYRHIFGDDFYLEVQDHGMTEQKKVLQETLRLSAETGIRMVATNDVHYVREPDHEVQDVLICIGTGKTVEDEDRLKIGTSQLYLKSQQQMAELFAQVPEAIRNAAAIADACQVELEFGRSILPQFDPIPSGMTAGDYLAELCRQGLEARYAGSLEWQDTQWRAEVEERLSYELGVIERMGYSDYFLIVWDFIRFAHEQGIVTGPGRGSSAGSLVAYTLSITDVDPIKYRLLFERFLNPERVTMPDIDIDFSDLRRDEVIDYVVRKYGRDRVAQIITFGTMAAKAAVRDVGRALNVPFQEVDRAAKMIPHQLGMTLEEALRVSPELQALSAKQPKTAELLRFAMKVEGMPRHASTHAAGVIISREPLTEYVPLQEGSEQTALTQYTMEHLESIGLLKMDFLGLRTLSIIERTLGWISEQTGTEIDWTKISTDDPLTYELLGKGDTTGVFQLESAGMRRVLKELRPSHFEDVISVLALYRPGPMDFIPKYISSKHGETEVEYPHPDLEPILRDTYGIIVYQEQIMQIASRMAGFNLGEADLLRRAVSKKKREVLDEQREHFVQGSLRQGYGEQDAHRVYDMIVRFADYGFPRAHAAAYGVLAFQTAYLKAHYPVQFMASMLTAVMGSHHKVAEYVDECRRMGIAVLPPDVNESGFLFTPTLSGGSPAIRFGLAAIKNVGTHAIESVIEGRREGPYGSLSDLCRRVDLRVCNKRVLESLVQGGALGTLPGHRAQQLAMLEEAVDAAVKWRKDREALQLVLDGFDEEVTWELEYPDISPYTLMQQLELERELLGLYISGSPLDDYEELLRKLEPDTMALLSEYAEGSEVLVAGLVVSNKTIVTKKGQPMAFMELEDRVGKAEVVLFPEVWKTYAPLVQKGNPVLVVAKLQHGDEQFKLLADRLIALSDPEAELKAAKHGAQSAAVPAGRAAGGSGYARGMRQARPPAEAAAAAGSRAQPAAVGGAAPAGPPVPGAGDARARPPQRGAGAGSGPQGGAAAAPSRGAQPPKASPQQAAARPARRQPGGPAAAPQARGAAADAARPASAAGQRVYVRIAADREQPAVLAALKELIAGHSGPLQVVLYYERTQKTLALSGEFNVKPSPQLFARIEELLGKQSVKVK